MKRFLTLICATMFAITAVAQPAPPPETVTVGGTGRATLAPDRFSFTVGVQTVAPTVDDAVAENNQRVSSVIAR